MPSKLFDGLDDVVTAAMEKMKLPKFSPLTKVFVRGSKDYEINAYQYATTSHQEGSMSPAAIICPRDVKDIQLAVNHAREQGIGIAVRTGGHMYTGASSTAGDNIQLNLSDTFESVIRDFCYDHDTGLLRAGVSFSLLQLNSLLRNMKMFIPHGQCAGVHVGGHVCSGKEMNKVYLGNKITCYEIVVNVVMVHKD